jgi:hypothetical protein
MSRTEERGEAPALAETEQEDIMSKEHDAARQQRLDDERSMEHAFRGGALWYQPWPSCRRLWIVHCDGDQFVMCSDPMVGRGAGVQHDETGKWLWTEAELREYLKGWEYHGNGYYVWLDEQAGLRRYGDTAVSPL